MPNLEYPVTNTCLICNYTASYRYSRVGIAFLPLFTIYSFKLYKKKLACFKTYFFDFEHPSPRPQTPYPPFVRMSFGNRP